MSMLNGNNLDGNNAVNMNESVNKKARDREVSTILVFQDDLKYSIQGFKLCIKFITRVENRLQNPRKRHGS